MGLGEIIIEPGSVSSNHMCLTTICNSGSKRPAFTFWLAWTPGLHVAHRYTCRQNNQTQKRKANLFKNSQAHNTILPLWGFVLIYLLPFVWHHVLGLAMGGAECSYITVAVNLSCSSLIFVFTSKMQTYYSRS